MQKPKEKMTVEQFRSLGKKKKNLKFRNKIIRTADGIFQSEWELKRWGQLKMLLLGNEISQLTRQVEHIIQVNGISVAKYISDFEYLDKSGAKVVEDTKSVATESLEAFRIKKALMKVVYNIDVKVILKPDYKANPKWSKGKLK